MKRFRCLDRFALGLCILILSTSWLGADTGATSEPASAAKTREAFLAIIDRPKVDLAAEAKLEGVDVGILRYHFTYASQADVRVPGLILMKQELTGDGKRHPAVIAMHGTGQAKESNLPLLRQLAEKGFIAVAIDGRYHGQRGNQADYNAAIARAFEGGGAHPLYYDTVWDAMRLIDYLQSRPDIDPHRIGVIGFSKGGIETWLTAAADPRVAVAVPCIGVQSFHWALENDAWHERVGTFKKGFAAAAKSAGVETPDAAFTRRFYDKVLPGIYDRFDGPVMLTLICPRPLLTINGQTDKLNPLPGLKLATDAAESAYTAAGASDHFHWIIEPKTGHKVTPDATGKAVEWFEKWIGDGSKQ